MSLRTEKTYNYRAVSIVRYNNYRSPGDMGSGEFKRFSGYLQSGAILLKLLSLLFLIPHYFTGY